MRSPPFRGKRYAALLRLGFGTSRRSPATKASRLGRVYCLDQFDRQRFRKSNDPISPPNRGRAKAKPNFPAADEIDDRGGCRFAGWHGRAQLNWLVRQVMTQRSQSSGLISSVRPVARRCRHCSRARRARRARANVVEKSRATFGAIGDIHTDAGEFWVARRQRRESIAVDVANMHARPFRDVKLRRSRNRCHYAGGHEERESALRGP